MRFVYGLKCGVMGLQRPGASPRIEQTVGSYGHLLQWEKFGGKKFEKP